MSNEAIDWAYRQDGLSGTSKSILVALANKADTDHSCYPGQKMIAELTGLAERTVRKRLADLELGGLLKRERRFDGGGHRTSDRYVLCVIPTGISGQWHEEPPVSETTGTRDHRHEVPSLPASGAVPTGTTCRVNQREPTEETTGTRPRITKSDISSFFAAFWKIYPRKVGKRGAQAEFERALKRGAAEEIVAGAERYRDDPNREEQFTKHPSTWLHQDCWVDDPMPSRGPQRNDAPWKKYSDE